MCILPLLEEINPSLSTKTVVSSLEEDASQDNTDVPDGSPLVTCRVISKLVRYTPVGEIKSTAHEEMCYAIK